MSNHKEYDAMVSRWKDARDAAAGEYEVHASRETHLPRLKDETDDAYKMRLKMTPWFGATWRTIIALRGMIFRRPPNVKVPPALELLLENIDNAGATFLSFSQKLTLDDLIVGRVGVLVDHTEVPAGATVADAGVVGARPYWCFYTTESILDWKYRTINGKRQLVMVRLKEDPENHDDVNLKEGEEINKLLKLENNQYTQTLVVIESREKKETVVQGWPKIPLRKQVPLDFIPFQPIGVDSLVCGVEVPPLMDLITMNYHHYVQSSAYERGCFLSGLPTLFVYGTDSTAPVYIGGSKANTYPDPQTKAEYVEVQSSFSALIANLEKKEYQMGVLGAKALEPRKAGVESGDAWERKQSGDESVLTDMSTTLSEGVTNPLKWLAWWADIEDTDIKVEYNKDFLPKHMDAQMVSALMATYVQGGISYDTLFYNFDRAGVYPPGTEQEEEQGKIEEGTPGMGHLSKGDFDAGAAEGDSGSVQPEGAAGGSTSAA